jgi:hypothetical protein
MWKQVARALSLRLGGPGTLRVNPAHIGGEADMRYVEFRDSIRDELCRHPGLTWAELRDRLSLPYDRPCPTWVKWLERDIGLSRAKGAGPAYVWHVRPPAAPER